MAAFRSQRGARIPDARATWIGKSWRPSLRGCDDARSFRSFLSCLRPGQRGPHLFPGKSPVQNQCVGDEQGGIGGRYIPGYAPEPLPARELRLTNVRAVVP